MQLVKKLRLNSSKKSIPSPKHLWNRVFQGICARYRDKAPGHQHGKATMICGLMGTFDESVMKSWCVVLKGHTCINIGRECGVEACHFQTSATTELRCTAPPLLRSM